MVLFAGMWVRLKGTGLPLGLTLGYEWSCLDEDDPEEQSSAVPTQTTDHEIRTRIEGMGIGHRSG
jgi:hypothetical protein